MDVILRLIALSALVISIIIGLLMIIFAQRIETWGWDTFMPILKEQGKYFDSENENPPDVSWQRPIARWFIRLFGFLQVCGSGYMLFIQLTINY